MVSSDLHVPTHQGARYGPTRVVVSVWCLVEVRGRCVPGPDRAQRCVHRMSFGFLLFAMNVSMKVFTAITFVSIADGGEDGLEDAIA